MSLRQWMSGPLKQGLRVIRLIVGFTVLAIGLLMLVFPGPAIVVIPIGLAILATELKWAKRLLDYMKRRAEAIGAALRCKKRPRDPEPGEGPSIGSNG
ncbi:MAG: PGPGW domain-containing protein [bacterium]